MTAIITDLTLPSGVTVSGNAISGSISFNGSSQYLTVPSSTAFKFGTGNFTVEGWFYFPTVPTNWGLWQLASSNFPGTAGLHLSYDQYWQVGYGSSSFVNNIGSASAVTAGSWIHVALVRNSNVLTLYVNGVGYVVASDTTNYNFTTNLVIGGYYSTSYLMTGYVSNLRIVNGVAVYTSNFTPPTSPLSAIAGSTLLTFQSSTVVDNANKPSGKFSFFFTLTLGGNAFSLQTFSPFGIIAGGGAAGGLGGGGAAYASAAGANGTTGTGGGGGGGSTINSSTGGTGGSGVVVFSYPTTSRAATSYAGATYQILGSNRVYTWLTSGSFTF